MPSFLAMIECTVFAPLALCLQTFSWYRTLAITPNAFLHLPEQVTNSIQELR